jgi:hypothetical protein
MAGSRLRRWLGPRGLRQRISPFIQVLAALSLAAAFLVLGWVTEIDAQTGPFSAQIQRFASRGAFPGLIYPAGSAITAGSATGLTVVNAGSVQEVTYKVTVATTAFVCAALTCDLTVGTLPAATWTRNVTAQLTQTFACAATCTSTTLSMVLGQGAGGAQYLASFDADAAAAVFGDADAEMGTTLTRAAAIQGATFNAGSQAIVLRLTSGTGNIGNGSVTNLSQGALTLWLTTLRLP